ncbi:tRNA(Met) cytidine acetyltransferase TmcA [Halochromatium salexigens]|nr:GNAT family N-acetyltransferase [Halochromatium salexigens]
MNERWPHRRLIQFAGGHDWGVQAAAEVIASRTPQRPVWLSNAPLPDAIPMAKAQQLLGGECDLLVMDLWSGLDADALGASVGSLRGGGLLLLLTPRLADWPHWIDPEAARIAVHPHSAAEVGTRFIARLARLLQSSAAVIHIDGSDTETAIDAVVALTVGEWQQRQRPTLDPTRPATPDQAQAVAAIRALVSARARRPLVLTADRGRGKSAALGIAAGEAILQHRARIIVTAPRRSAVEPLFAHAQATLRAASASEAEPLLSFAAPDALLADSSAPDLLMIDEAAGIPAPLLEQLLMRYPRICFATTVHGYEGTGRGFELRFRALLEQRTPGWRALHLKTPIRWRQDDALEQLIDQILLLDAEPAADARIAATDLASARFAIRSPETLANDEALLRQLFGLLVLGHYQTRPNDLRHLLDGPNLEVATLSVGAEANVGSNVGVNVGADIDMSDLVLATALIAREGTLASELLQPIFEGRRRPRGHLLPQTLSAHAGLAEAPELGYARIVRIAVHPAARRRGLGRRLVGELATRARRDGLDLLGASFGASAELLAFWRRCGLAPLHLGTRRNTASGAHAAVVLQALSPAGEALVAHARTRLGDDLPSLLSGPLQAVEPSLVAALLQELPQRETIGGADDQRQIDAFADAHRSFEAALPALERLVRAQLVAHQAGIQGGLEAEQRDLLISSLLQRRAAEVVIRERGLSGRGELLQRLRAAIGALRDCQQDHQRISNTQASAPRA